MKPINLAEKLSGFIEHWQPRTVGQFNGHDLMVAKIKGEFVWHKHDDTDDFFLVLERPAAGWNRVTGPSRWDRAKFSLCQRGHGSQGQN